VDVTFRLPLPTQLSAALVAYTIEFDNEFEYQMAHWTTRGPWLVSQVMWANVMQYVDEAGVSVDELHRRACTTRDMLGGLARWGYVVVAADSADSADTRSKPPRGELIVRATPNGKTAQEIWRPLAGTIEERWRKKFGTETIATLRESLQAVIDQIELRLPAYLPVISPTGTGQAELPMVAESDPKPSVGDGSTPIDLSAMLSRVLLAFTLDFESQTRISLATCADTLRVLDTSGVRIRDLPRLTGVSKEANSMTVGFLRRHGCAEVESDPTLTRGNRVRLTAKGQKAQDTYLRVLASTEEQWHARFGARNLANLRQSLDRLVGAQPTAEISPLFQCLEPYPDGWRASVRRPDTLPHYPMVLHRGGYPDGS
jgi:DNA-binding MarR family transcriptional regulator